MIVSHFCGRHSRILVVLLQLPRSSNAHSSMDIKFHVLSYRRSSNCAPSLRYTQPNPIIVPANQDDIHVDRDLRDLLTPSARSDASPVHRATRHQWLWTQSRFTSSKGNLHVASTTTIPSSCPPHATCSITSFTVDHKTIKRSLALSAIAGLHPMHPDELSASGRAQHINALGAIFLSFIFVF